MIRILGGTFRSREVIAPKGMLTRPTSSQIRACVFNMCQEAIVDARFLDICAGSGAMGLEAISRGAQFAGFIEHNRQATFAIKENIKRFGLEESCRLFFGDALHVLKGLKEVSFDICYFDPPYSDKKGMTSHLVTSVLELLDQTPHLLSNTASVFVEESVFADLQHVPLQKLKLDSVRRFGNSQLFCYKTQALN